MARVVRESVMMAGRPERARVACAFVCGMLGPGHPCRDDAALLVSELFGNSVWHSGSGAAGQTVTVAVRLQTALSGSISLTAGGRGVPELRASDGNAEDGRRPGLVAGLSARWGRRRRGGRTVTWFELRHG